jgi:hypothetical protein
MSRREILARVRRLSIARVSRHGPLMPEDPGVWWQQIEALATELSIPITWDEWCSVAKQRKESDP